MPVLIVLIGAALGATFAHQRPASARRMVTALDRSGASKILNVAAIATLPVGHPMAATFKLLS